MKKILLLTALSLSMSPLVYATKLSNDMRVLNEMSRSGSSTSVEVPNTKKPKLNGQDAFILTKHFEKTADPHKFNISSCPKIEYSLFMNLFKQRKIKITRTNDRKGYIFLIAEGTEIIDGWKMDSGHSSFEGETAIHAYSPKSSKIPNIEITALNADASAEHEISSCYYTVRMK